MLRLKKLLVVQPVQISRRIVQVHNASLFTDTTDTSQELSYVFKYAELKEKSTGNPWRIRQTGVYHTFDRHRNTSVFVLVSPHPAAKFETYTKSVLRDPDNRSQILSTPLLLHTMLISTHLDAWRNYLEYLEKFLLKAVRVLLRINVVKFD